MKFLKRNTPEPVHTENESTREKERIGRPMLFPIVFCLASGLLLILLESLTMTITGYVLAAMLIASSVWLVVEYIRSTPLVRIVEAKLAIGLILLVAGFMLVFSPESLKDLLPYAWGLALLFGGFLKIQYAFDRKSLGAEKWWILLILAAVSIVLGVISLLNKEFLGDKKELVIGILLTVEAVLDIVVFLLLKRKIRKKATAENQPVSVPAPAPEPVPAPEAPAEPGEPETDTPETDTPETEG
ncbi:MAG: DUF308 domain-containing protein [Clostridia bacterium]|nr:DUF308 domain-containing protein [Clostridia bacterium]